MFRTALRSRCLITFLLLWIALPVCADSPASPKFFIRVEVPPGFPSQAGDILTVVEENLPVDVLKSHNLEYDNPAAYLEVQHWNPKNKFLIRDKDQISWRFKQFNIHKMLTLSLSPFPGRPGDGRLLMTGKLVDLARMDEILEYCLGPTATEQAMKDLKFINCDKINAFQAVEVASVEVESFAAFREALRRLFTKLLHIPAITLDAPTALPATNRPFQSSTVDVRVSRNEHAVAAVNEAQRRSRTVGMDVQLVELPFGDAGRICAEPDLYWEQLECDLQPSAKCMHRYRTARKLKVTQSSLEHIIGKIDTSTAWVSFEAPNQETDLLLRITAWAQDKELGENRIHAQPGYRCFKVREPQYYVGADFRGAAHAMGDSHEAETYPVSYRENLGVDLRLAIRGNGFRRTSRSALDFMNLLIGWTRMSGWYPCAPGHSGYCAGVTEVSDTFEFRLQMEWVPVRLWRFSPSLYWDYGLGAEHAQFIASDSEETRWGPVVMMGAGSRVSFFWKQMRAHLGVLLQMRANFLRSGVPGLPGLGGVLWVTLGADLGVH